MRRQDVVGRRAIVTLFAQFGVGVCWSSGRRV